MLCNKRTGHASFGLKGFMQTRSAYFFFIVFSVILLFIDWYVFQGVQTLTETWQKPVQVLVHGVYWGLMVGLIPLLYYSLSSRRKGEFSLLARIIFHIVFIVFVTQLVFLVVLFAEDLYRTSVALVHMVSPSGHATAFPERMRWISQVGIALAGVPFISLVYGITRGKYKYRVHKHTLYFKDLPKAFDGFTITQISDVHAGSFNNAAAVQRGINLIKAQKSDLFVFTGDLVNNQAVEIEPWLGHFDQVTAPHGKFAVLGNHDYGDYILWNSESDKVANLEQLKQHHATLGHRLLLDENVSIEKDGQKIVLMGVENWGAGFGMRGDLKKALHGVDDKAFKILLSHDPSHWDAQVKQHPSKIHLTLSGHTHGMQFGIEVRGLRWSPVQYRYKNWAGLAEHNGRYLHVNRGFGFLGFEGRVGIWPEVTVIELRKN